MTIRQTKTEERLQSIIQNEIARAENREEDVDHNHQAALRAYEGEPKTDDADTYEAQSNDVRDMTSAVVAQLVPMLSTDALVSFPPRGDKDEEQARAESYAVDHIIMERNQGFIEIEEAVKDALLLRNCCAKVYMEEDRSIRHIPLEIDGEQLPNEQIAALLQPRLPNEVRKLDGDQIKATITKRRFRFSAVDIANVCWEANADTSNIQDFRFFAERLMYTRSELVAMGHPKAKIDQLPKYAENASTTVLHRNRSRQSANTAETKDQDSVECFEVYIRVDLDNDGVSERYRVLYAGTYILEYEAEEVIPYAVGTAIIRPHRLTGESLYDHLADIQQVKTDFLRQWLTNTRHLQGGRYFANPAETNYDDLHGNSPMVRHKDMRKPPIPMQIQDIGQSVRLALDYMDKRRTEAGGAALDMVSADFQTFAETAHGIERQYSQKELLVSLYAKNLAETLIRPAYLLMHGYLRRFANEPVELKLAGEWTKVDPRQWPERDQADATAGKSAGERAHLQRTLQSLIQMQLTAMQQGMSGQIADMGTLYNAIVDWARAAGLETPDSYVINPNSQQAQQNARIAQQQRQQAQQLQQTLIREQLKLEYAKLAQKAKEANDDIGFKYWSERLQSEIEEMKLVAGGVMELDRIQLEGQYREANRLNGAQERTTGADGVTP